MNQSSIDQYREMITMTEKEIDHYSRLVNRYSFLRLFALIGGAFAIWQTFALEKVWLTEISFLLVFILFLWLVSRQSKYDRTRRYFVSLKTVNQNEIDSIVRGSNIYNDGSDFEDNQHAYTSDLDILGKSSLFNLINRCATSLGNQKLAAWLLNAACNDEIQERQEAVKELASASQWKLRFQALLLFSNGGDDNSTLKLLEYLRQVSFSQKAWVVIYIAIVPWLMAGLAVTSYFYTPALLLLIVLGITNLFFVLFQQVKVNKADMALATAGSSFSKFGDVFDMLEQRKWSSPLCVRLQDQLRTENGVKLSKQIKQLSSILDRLRYRFNVFIGPVLNFLMAWDLRQLLAIEKWRDENESLIGRAFDVLASMECLLSIAGLHINHPDWCFPRLSDDEGYTLGAEGIGHPLIPERERIMNDYVLLNDHKIDIITGSNMAGKSTFLRTLGINAVLAFCGAPVCALSLSISNMNIFTYMRIKDSLNDSISTFKAELNRLQMLLEELQKGGKVFFLIDEMLRGTNSADKYLGSKAIIEKLIGQKAVGIVATHDLQIADLEKKYPEYIRNFYFDIHVQDNEMRFDYKLKKGACKTFNASLLLKQLGVEIQDSQAGPA